MELITELFEGAAAPVVNLNPKHKIPQIFAIQAGEESVLPGFRFCTYTSAGDTNKNLKPGDKMMHIVMIGVNEKLSLVKLKNLGGNAVGVINAVFDTALQTMKQYKIDACLFRVLKNKTGGQARQMQVIADRLVRTKGAGRYVLLKDIWDYDKKYAYIMVYRKNVNLEDIPGVPPISTELFTKIESKVGDVYVDVKTGKTVPKTIAVAASIAAENDKRTDQAVIQKTKISRRLAAQAQYSTIDAALQDGSKAAQKYQEFEAKVPVYKAEGAASEGAEQISQNFKKGAIMNMYNNSVFKSRSDELDNLRRHIAYVHSRLNDNLTGQVSDTVAYGAQAYERNKEFFNSKTQSILSDLKEINTSNSFEVIKKIVNDLVKSSKATPEQKALAIQFTMNSLYKLIDESISAAYSYSSDMTAPKGLTQAESDAIEEYCADGYAPMNAFLLGKPESTVDYKMEGVIDMIEALDSAFTKGTVLPKGTILYRGQSVPFKTLRHNIDNKMFYFKNFVSTSLKPNIFGEYGKNYMVLDDKGVAFSGEGEGSVEDAEELLQYGSHDTRDTTAPGTEFDEERRAEVGMVIRGAEQVKVIIPGKLTYYMGEAEVILPRGILLKVNKVSTYVMKDRPYNKYLIEGTVIPPSEQLEESVYDGDHLLETGEVRPMAGFAQFLLKEAEDTSTEASEILASMINTSEMSEKFKM